MFNFMSGTALAHQQDEYLQIYLNEKTLSFKEIQDMEDNLWVAMASKLAPNNLVIRQWALIDLFKKFPDHKNSIEKLINILAPENTNSTLRIWKESYSYYEYTMNIIKPWIKKFDGIKNITDIKDTISAIEQGFIVTSYLRNKQFYPAPFGDLRDQPLRQDLQIPHQINNRCVGDVCMEVYLGMIFYTIKGLPIGLNAHVQINDSDITIKYGLPEDFKFYEGYDKKYKNKFDEIKDLLNIKRLQSLKNLLIAAP